MAVLGEERPGRGTLLGIDQDRRTKEGLSFSLVRAVRVQREGFNADQGRELRHVGVRWRRSGGALPGRPNVRRRYTPGLTFVFVYGARLKTLAWVEAGKPPKGAPKMLPD
jgi:hypothetical protein